MGGGGNNCLSACMHTMSVGKNGTGKIVTGKNGLEKMAPSVSLAHIIRLHSQLRNVWCILNATITS